MCDNSEPPLLTSTGDTYFCGRGGKRCPDGYVCHTDPADRYAICCPFKKGKIWFRILCYDVHTRNKTFIISKRTIPFLVEDQFNGNTVSLFLLTSPRQNVLRLVAALNVVWRKTIKDVTLVTAMIFVLFLIVCLRAVKSDEGKTAVRSVIVTQRVQLFIVHLAVVVPVMREDVSSLVSVVISVLQWDVFLIVVW